jgi:hypothetical protein
VSDWTMWRGQLSPKRKKRHQITALRKGRWWWYTWSSWGVISMRTEPQGRKARPITDVTSTALGKEGNGDACRLFRMNSFKIGSSVACRPVAMKRLQNKWPYKSRCYKFSVNRHECSNSVATIAPQQRSGV